MNFELQDIVYETGAGSSDYIDYIVKRFKNGKYKIRSYEIEPFYTEAPFCHRSYAYEDYPVILYSSIFREK